MFIQASGAEAPLDVTDGFNGLVVHALGSGHRPGCSARSHPLHPVGQPRRHRAGRAWSSCATTDPWTGSSPTATCSPTRTTSPPPSAASSPTLSTRPRSRTGDMIYVGARFNFANGKTKLGLEYNQGSEYWFNWRCRRGHHLRTEDLHPRRRVGGLPHPPDRQRFRPQARLHEIRHTITADPAGIMGAPKELGTTPAPILGFPTPSSIDKFLLGFMARF